MYVCNLLSQVYDFIVIQHTPACVVDTQDEKLPLKDVVGDHILIFRGDLFPNIGIGRLTPLSERMRNIINNPDHVQDNILKS